MCNWKCNQSQYQTNLAKKTWVRIPQIQLEAKLLMLASIMRMEVTQVLVPCLAYVCEFVRRRFTWGIDFNVWSHIQGSIYYEWLCGKILVDVD
jgi:hypothetical protein